MNNHYRDRSVLVIGGLGFIGSHLSKALVAQGARVTVLDGLLPAGGANIRNLAEVRDSLRINYSDLRDPYALAALVTGQSVIFNLAAQTSHVRSMRCPKEDLALNCESALALLECCREHNPQAKIVYTSTRQIYGRAQYLPVDERHPLAPTDINGIHKLTAENYHTLYGRLYGLACMTLRLTNTYGPNMDLHPDKGFVGVFLSRALRGETIRIFGDGSQRRDFNYVADVVSALLLAGHLATPGHQVFNLGHEQAVSLCEFVEILTSLLPTRYEFQPFPSEIQQIDIGDYYGDYSRFLALTGWQPQVSLSEGLSRTVESYISTNSNSSSFGSSSSNSLTTNSLTTHSSCLSKPSDSRAASSQNLAATPATRSVEPAA